MRMLNAFLPARGPVPELPFLGHALAMRADSLGFLGRLSRQHEGLAPFRLGPARGYVLLDPDLVEEVLRSKAKRYTRQTRVYTAMARFLGQGILITEGDEWRKHRRIVQPAFHRKRLTGYADRMTAIAEECVGRWEGEVNVPNAMMRMTLQIVSETLLGIETRDHAEAIGSAVDAAQRYAESVIGGLVELPSVLPTARNRMLRSALETIDRIAYERIREKRASPGNDVISMLVEATYEDGSALPDRQIRDELITLLAAGHETTANALSWTLFRLGRHPLIARRVVDEVDRVLEGRSPTLDDISKLTYLRWVFDETLRLHPPAWTTGRLALDDHQLGPRRVEAGSLLLISPWVLQRRPELWPNPEGFDPDRWEALSAPGALHPFAFFPFGGGPRKCVGEAFAYLEAILVLAVLAQRVRLELLPGQRAEPAAQITLGFKHGLRATVHPR
ncbi:MAG: cytochrome P450 [Myxococcota bacterium]